MSFLRHAGIYRSDVAWHNLESWGRGTASRWSAPGPAKRRDGTAAPRSSSAMSSRAGYSLAGCSPAEPASASPTTRSMRYVVLAGNGLSANGNLSLIYVSQGKGAVQTRLSSLRKYPFRSSGNDKPVALSCKLLRKRGSNDENGIAAIQRRCRAGSRHRCVDERACR